jgi:hypothetical protein
MGMFDEVHIQCPRCYEYFIVQSKAGKRTLASYTLDDAPLAIVADIHEDGKNDKLYCQHCKTLLEIRVKFISFVACKRKVQILFRK